MVLDFRIFIFIFILTIICLQSATDEKRPILSDPKKIVFMCVICKEQCHHFRKDSEIHCGWIERILQNTTKRMLLEEWMEDYFLSKEERIFVDREDSCQEISTNSIPRGRILTYSMVNMTRFLFSRDVFSKDDKGMLSLFKIFFEENINTF